MAEVVEKVVPVLLQQARPVVAGGYGALLVEGLLGPFGGHLEEEEKGELLDIVAVAHAVVPEDVAEVPEFLDHCGWGHFITLPSGRSEYVCRRKHLRNSFG